MKAALDWLTNRFELARDGGDRNVPSMEGLRGFAVFLVFVVHYVSLMNPWISAYPALYKLADVLHAMGNAGVDLFFVLSGYLIYGALIARPRKFTAFIARRARRIYPAFLAVFLLYLVVSCLLPVESRIPAGGWDAVIYLSQNLLLLPGLFPIEPFITVAWSLSYEMAYYIVIPVVIGVLGLRSRTRTARIAFFLLVASGGAVACGAFGGPIRLIMFLAGVVLFEIVEGQIGPTPRSMNGLLALATGLVIVWLPPELLPTSGSASVAVKIGILFVCFLVLCLACFRSPTAWLATAFSWTPLRWLGNMSYSYYLLHGLALKGAFLVVGKMLSLDVLGPSMFWALLPFMFAATLPPAALLFIFVERPFSLVPGARSPSAPISAGWVGR